MASVRVTRLGHLEPDGAFNDGIEVWQMDDTRGQFLIKKVFLPRDLPDHPRREVITLQQLRPCPYIVRVYDWHTGDRSAHIFMECCGKGTIKALLREHMQRRVSIPEKFI